MAEVVLLPEMLAAGLEAMAECEKRHLENRDVVVAVYLAMEAVKAIAMLRGEEETMH